MGEQPLLLGELGMDTLRNGEAAQASFLCGHLREATMAGLTGAFVFAWTDEWHAGGQAIRDWEFGITRVDRSPKVSYHQLRDVFDRSPAASLRFVPRVSVVVCSYNGGRTLSQCVRSLLELDYPDFEVIVVDDGSSDQTAEILGEFPEVVTIREPNLGLSAARNAGLAAATGSVIAYTDSDCFADQDWLTHLVEQLERTGAAAVGGPNLTPEDGWLHACIAAAPGQPTHVLFNDQEAEHVPGCNMAFRREALGAINGFDTQFRTAGDDVDVCWRLQHEGYWITFAPGAFVWHHRRQTPGRYLGQQMGYGQAEGLLCFKHPDKFTGWGKGKWSGIVYGTSIPGLRLTAPFIHRGRFGTGMFQCLYQAAPSHWAMLPSTLEWHASAALLAVVALLIWSPLAWVSAGMLSSSFLVAAAQAGQTRIAPGHDHWGSRLLVAALFYLQPLVRSWARYRTRLLSRRRPRPDPAIEESYRGSPWLAARSVAYWSESGGPGRVELLEQAVASMTENGWGKVLDSGWFDWDMSVYCGAGTVLKVTTVEEDHGAARRLIRVRYRLSTEPLLAIVWLGAIAAFALFGSLWAKLLLVLALALGLRHWWYACQSASRVVALFDTLAHRMGLVRCPVTSGTLSRGSEAAQGLTTPPASPTEPNA